MSYPHPYGSNQNAAYDGYPNVNYANRGYEGYGYDGHGYGGQSQPIGAARYQPLNPYGPAPSRTSAPVTTPFPPYVKGLVAAVIGLVLVGAFVTVRENGTHTVTSKNERVSVTVPMSWSKTERGYGWGRPDLQVQRNNDIGVGIVSLDTEDLPDWIPLDEAMDHVINEADRRGSRKFQIVSIGDQVETEISGHEAVELMCEVEVGGRVGKAILVLFETEERLYLVYAACPDDEWDDQRDVIRSAIDSIHIKE